MTDAAAPRVYRYYDFVMAAFVVILILSNLIGAAKVANLAGYPFGAGVLFFPLSYVLGDVLTEVYGYARARRVVWAGFGGLVFMAFMSWAVVSMPPDPSWSGQAAYEQVFGQTPRIVLASLCAFWAGEFANAFVMARMKVLTRGRYLWTRTIGSTVVGQGIDSLLFYPVAFLGVWDTSTLVFVAVTNFGLKVAWEALLTPVTYRVVARLKRLEKEDYYDTDTNFTPFSIER
ncbi:hypothetical protein EV659_101421 [Rhodothalassium salexigens DSM 2132]|uniref:Probable queuosine precursor transporter n=1 Tax=Rhodothalassium salexigens DSM 2132 TaxID=1188247 RepID=A0A4R2PRY3_RHOSA|nr:queuosine precursor transporter [Rhodothalassium salexigens]MBB4210353.1 hypothetical protein [Rhodothalassium salexigens DSM 2132]MBK1638894.1 hypothetical protein [Rhodothalassium salexigens DSM 2132]TCP38517.1 hypothetical protein EV659_101421 [Rhodothalassium salexigens DSM 2132]